MIPLKRICFTALCVILLLPSNFCVYAIEPARPHIILVMVDDVSAREFSCYGGEGIETPHIDMMAREGISFGTAYAQPLCGPTRATLHSGKYAHRNLNYGNAVLPPYSFFYSHYTMGEVMKDAGYFTAWFGKQHLDNNRLNPDQAGYNHYVATKYWEGYDGTWQERGSPTAGMYSVQWYWHPGLLCNGTGIPTGPGDFGPSIELDSILSTIRNRTDDPLFIYWPTNLPHHQYSIADGWTRPDIPVLDADGNPTGERIPGSLKSNLEFMDRSIGEILSTLEEEGILENTLLFFVGDNGTAGYGKGMLQNEIGSRVPFIVYGPGILEPAGRSDVLVDFTDILPTFMELAGHSAVSGEQCDGKSFAPYLLGRPFEPRQWISTQLNEARWIRTREWLLDGLGHLWYCGSSYDESTFVDVTFDPDPMYLAKWHEMKAILDCNIPYPDFNDPLLKASWEREFSAREPYDIYEPPLRTLAYVTSDVYNVDETLMGISDIPAGTGVDDFLANLAPAPGAIITLLDGSDNVKVEGGVTSDDKVKVVAEDEETEAFYTLDVMVSTRDMMVNGISIYPNPVSDVLFITGLTKGSTIHLTSITGQKVKVIEAVNDPVKVSVEGLAKGYYIINVIDSDQNSTLFRFVKLSGNSTEDCNA